LYSSKFTTKREEITEPCSEDICSGISYDPVIGILTFNVSHFSSFTTTSSSCPVNYTDCNGDGTGTDVDGCENPYPKCACLTRGSNYFCTNYAWFYNYYGASYAWCVGRASPNSYWSFGSVIDSKGEAGGFPDCSQSQYCCFDYYSDFIATCGNGVCDNSKPYYAENNGNCPRDCYIGDGVCDANHENTANDPNDCCTDTAQCSTLQYCSENNMEDCSIKKSSEISGVYNFKNLTIDSSVTLKAIDNLTINAENIKIYGNVIVNHSLAINATNVEIYGKIDGKHSDEASFLVNSKRYYDVGSTVDFSGENGVKGKDGISGANPTAGEDGTEGKSGKPITINTEIFEGGSFISNGGNGGSGGRGGSGGCVGSTEPENYCDGGLCSCSGNPNGKDGGIGGKGGDGGIIAINAKISKGAISAIAHGGNAGNGGDGGDGSRGPTTGTYKESFSWGGRYYTITHILYNGGDSGSGRKAGEAGKGGAINMNFDKHSCSKAGNLSVNGGNGGEGGDAGKPYDGSVCYTSFTSSCFPNLPGKAGLAGKSSSGGDAGAIAININKKDNIPAISNYQFSANGGNAGDGGNGAKGAYSCYNNRNGPCRYPGCTESSLMADATDGTEGSNGGNAGAINIDGLIVGCAKFSLNGGNGGSGGRGGDAQGNTGSGSNAGNGGNAGIITGLKESSCKNTFSLNAGNGGNGGDAGNSASCLAGPHCSAGNMCDFCSYYYDHQTGISGDGGNAGDGGEAGSCSDCNAIAKGGEGGIAGKSGKDYGEGCSVSLVSSYCGKPCKPSGTEGINGADKGSASFTNTASIVDKTCLQYDLKIDGIKPIQVIENTPLVSNKKMIVRVDVNLDSSDVEELENVNVQLDYNGNTYSLTKPVRKKSSYNLLEDPDREDIKLCNDAFIFKDLPLLPKGEYKINAIVDPNDEFLETNEENNNFEGQNKKQLKINLKSTNNLNLLFIPISVHGTTDSGGDIPSEIDFTRATYPVSDNGIEDNYYNGAIQYNDKIPISYFKRLELFKKINKAGMLYFASLNAPFDASYTRFIGYVPLTAFVPGEGASVVLEAAGYQDIFSSTAILATISPGTIAHELGHSFGLYNWQEEYEQPFSPPNGKIIKNLNIYRSDRLASGFDRCEYTLSHIEQSASHNEKIAFMGTGQAGYNPIWADGADYTHLYNRFIDKVNDPHLLLISGMLYKNGSVEIETMYPLKEGVSHVMSGGNESAYSIELISESGKLLNKIEFNPFNAYEKTRFKEEVDKLGSFPFAFAIDYPIDLKKVLIKYNGNTAKELVKSAKAPEVKIIALNKNFIKWKSIDIDSKNLSYIIAIFDENNKIVHLDYDIKDTEYKLNLPEGTYKIDIIASDNFNIGKDSSAVTIKNAAAGLDNCKDNGIHLGNAKPDCHADQGQNKSENKEKI
ncbi:hypothetical protein HYT26_03860, partial [Candidatus Pacearchaeota archaeon]|nr:hypothetical protein [Candidatus Pacearchaeota archaeon]